MKSFHIHSFLILSFKLIIRRCDVVLNILVPKMWLSSQPPSSLLKSRFNLHFVKIGRAHSKKPTPGEPKIILINFCLVFIFNFEITFPSSFGIFYICKMPLWGTFYMYKVPFGSDFTRVGFPIGHILLLRFAPWGKLNIFKVLNFI